MILIIYKKATLKYEILEKYTAGIELVGAEVKTLRKKLGNLDGSRVIVRGGEVFVVGMTIPPYQANNTPKEYDPARTRRLLLTKREIKELANAEMKKRLTIVPLSVYNDRHLLKMQVAIVHGKNKADKREYLKRKDAQREAQRALGSKH
ncbi:MAG TPA: SsrA-binding protein SmpB [Candidatus Kaiserbacteria bacterium]|nr:SsrA-binding protein SmpB [Candidatus Kaiserbacteria bacterium]